MNKSMDRLLDAVDRHKIQLEAFFQSAVKASELLDDNFNLSIIDCKEFTVLFESGFTRHLDALQTIDKFLDAGAVITDVCPPTTEYSDDVIFLEWRERCLEVQITLTVTDYSVSVRYDDSMSISSPDYRARDDSVPHDEACF